MQYDELSQRYQDAAKELLPSLSEVGGETLQEKIKIQSDEPTSLTGEFTLKHEYPLLKVTLGSTTDVTYAHSFLMDKSVAGLIFSWMVGGEEPEEVGQEHLDAVKEVAAQILGQLQAAFKGEKFSFSAGDVQLVEVPSQEDLGLPEEGLVVTYRFSRGKKKKEYLITHVLTGDLIPAEAVEESGIEEAVEESGAEEAVEESGAEEAADLAGDEDITKEVAETVTGDLPVEGDEDLGVTADMTALFGGEGDEGGVVEVSPAELDELAEPLPRDGKGRKIDLLLDVELDVTVELGRKIMVVEDILRLGKGAVIELDKLAGEPVDVLVNGKKLAEGEVVVVEDHFGVRLTHLLEPSERIKSLGK
jgi:flagellar motor switch protein FliN/FliY